MGPIVVAGHNLQDMVGVPNELEVTVDQETGAQMLAALSGVHRLGRVAEGSLLAGDEIPASVISVLGLLAHDGELRLGRVAASLGVDASVASRAVAHADELGLVSRRPDPGDGRAFLLSLTPEGARSLADRRNRRLRLLTSVMDGWDQDSAQTLLAGLTRLQSDLAAHSSSRAAPDPAGPDPAAPGPAGPAARP
jgi:DNA-binding MarR family transcriptional regulator